MGLFSFPKDNQDLIKQTSGDKRLVPRWKISVPAKIKLEGFNSYLDCEVRDLNLKGFSLVIAKKILKKRTGAKLCFNKKFSFNIETLVLWSKAADNKYVYGMKFTRILDADRERILQMMNEDFPANVWKNL
ncbi:MAG: PilZ domain-containing protein [Candidatus Omnitrophica bacterium]|nr:PilZ domain-containing protein [Candidatus Omnitrophota bacterium]MBU1924025.1 PilZ domain-containing protein [Candidatus Omnitrophota bacterium]